MKGFALKQVVEVGLAIPTVLICAFGSVVHAADPATHTIVIEAMKFFPGTLTVHPGDTVVFKNADLVPHTATEKTSKAFDSGILNRNAEWKFVPKRSGTLHYQCTLHPGMEGVIIVEEGPSASPQ